MSLFEPQDLSVCAAMGSPSYTRIPSAVPDEVTPGQRSLITRNETMLEGLREALADVENYGRLIPSQTKWMVKRFLQLLPASVPATDVYVSDEQSICFDWDEDVECQLSVMVQQEGRIAFAAYFGGDRLNGATSFTGTDLPNELSSAIARWQRGGERH